MAATGQQLRRNYPASEPALFLNRLSAHSRGHDEPSLRPATAAEIADSLSFALRYDGRRRVHHADDAMARITADRLVEHLGRCGFVLLKRPDAAAPSASHHSPKGL
jgi:hypothetical protein